MWRAGSVEVTPDIAEELLKAADQYMLEGLKRLCEAAISTGLCTDNLASVHDLSENYNAPQLARRCVLYSLEHFEEMVRVCSLSLQNLRWQPVSSCLPANTHVPCSRSATACVRWLRVPDKQLVSVQTGGFMPARAVRHTAAPHGAQAA